MKALILVDIQNDFVTGGALAVPQGEKIVPIVNKLIPQFDLVIATQDWHPANHGSFAANHAGKNIGEIIDLHGLPQILWPVHCVQNTKGAEFVKELDTAKIQKVFVKGTDSNIDSYSGFFDNGHKKSTGLGDYLHQKGVKEVYVCGLATDYCVKFTALDARQLGFETYLIEDASRGVNLQPTDVENAILDMKKAGVKVLKSNQV
ncbi:MAG: bifunctional nicotinamidase/pyrazinamidase [Flammeovirgaceae bacterium]